MRGTGMFGVWAAVCIAVAHAGAAATFDVAAFGAKGDGQALNTAAVQKAIDAAHDAGGGTVRIGAGVFVTGPLFLKSGVDFFLDHGSTLKASPNKADFRKGSIHQLLLCIRQTNVTVRGTGRIDGNSGAYIIGPDGRNWPRGERGIPWRFNHMLMFKECHNIRLEGVSLIDSSQWSCFFHGCTHVTVKDVMVRTRREPVHTHNGDGIDIDSCEDVELTGCDIDTADDSITLRAVAKGISAPRPCRRIRVSNCRLSSACNAVRIGVGSGVVQDAEFRNIEIWDTRTGVDIVSGWSAGSSGVSFTNIVFDGVTVEAQRFCRVYPRHAKEARFDGIRFANVKGVVAGPSWVTGRAACPIGDVTFENVDLPHGVNAFNVADLKIVGGTLVRNPIPEDQLKKYNAAIDRHSDFPGFVRIRGTVRGGTAFGGTVKMPPRESAPIPCSTRAAIAAAVRKRVPAVAFDIRRDRTGVFVLTPDATCDAPPPDAERRTTLDEALDVVPDGGIWIHVRCRAGCGVAGELARLIKVRGRLHQAILCADPADLDDARRAVPEILTKP